jgi:hypothetical protein
MATGKYTHIHRRIASNERLFRVEMITTAFWLEKWAKLVKWWVKTVGNGYLPEHIYYFRDGVSEGQYQQVLDNEVRDMKMILKQMYSEAADVRLFILQQKDMLTEAGGQIHGYCRF